MASKRRPFAMPSKVNIIPLIHALIARHKDVRQPSEELKQLVKALIRSHNKAILFRDMIGPVDIFTINGTRTAAEARTFLNRVEALPKTIEEYCNIYSAISIYTVTIEPSGPGVFVRGYFHQ
jgi:hypothetical protein